MIRNCIKLLPILFFAFVIVIQAGQDINPEIEKKVQKLLSKMTLEEKIGQMTQLTIGAFADQRGYVDTDFILNEEKLREAIVDYNIGSILNVYDKALTVDQWHELLTIIHDMSKETRLNIPIIYGIDAIHGMNYTVGATLFPQSIGLAASGNLDLVYESAKIEAYECKASGIPWNFNPVLGVGRHPMWPRHWETFGEDPYMVNIMGEFYTKGLQGDTISAKESVSACMKHYLGYSNPLSGRDRTPAYIPERQLREIYLPPFKTAVDIGTYTVMINSGEINGIPVHTSEFALKQLLRNELGFIGFTVSDWDDINKLHTHHKVASSKREAVKMAVMAGIDMSMVPMEHSFYELLLDLVNSGEVPISRIDEAVANILRVKFMLGLFDNRYPDKSLSEKFACDEFTEVNLQAARESITLLKNEDNILPLKKDSKVLVTGPTANLLKVLNGGWSIVWGGETEELFPQEKFTVLEAIQEKIGDSNVEYVEGSTVDVLTNVEEAVKAAENVDVIVACLGEMTYTEAPGNINDLTLDEAQLQLVKALSNTGKPIVLVMIEGRPRVIRTIVDYTSGVVLAYLPGNEGGIAIADVLFGDVNPSGKLPYTYPKYPGGFTCYDHRLHEVYDDFFQYNAQWAFGHGLSYTTFEYSDLHCEKDKVSCGDNFTVTVKVKNTGEKTGKEIVQLYLHDEYASVTRPLRQLVRFEKIELQPQEEKTVTFTLSTKDLSFIGRDMQRIVEPGNFTLKADTLSTQFSFE